MKNTSSKTLEIDEQHLSFVKHDEKSPVAAEVTHVHSQSFDSQEGSFSRYVKPHQILTKLRSLAETGLLLVAISWKSL